ncbi:hypothetical protein SAMN05421761_11056 [Belliella pelovolcani]|uniref:Uncharacterized protein n=1 Tax=Belliella pelovolcani TaxID=529505 RepID=A0A1N7NIU9_9BACT|nr:hypothetical protein SAMN05421761_11056 [Belliella pelovolcani]
MDFQFIWQWIVKVKENDLFISKMQNIKSKSIAETYSQSDKLL